MGCSGVLWDVPGVFRGCSGLFRAVPGCSGGVPGVFRGVPGVFRGVPGVFRVLQTPPTHRIRLLLSIIQLCVNKIIPQFSTLNPIPVFNPASENSI